MTVVGPHRDDLDLFVAGQPAAAFASEGQKRSLVIALKMAQAEIPAEIHGAPPVLLIDDVMGELDAGRRAGFLPLLERVEHGRSQVFMTCTEQNWPRDLGRALTVGAWSAARSRRSGNSVSPCDWNRFLTKPSASSGVAPATNSKMAVDGEDVSPQNNGTH